MLTKKTGNEANITYVEDDFISLDKDVKKLSLISNQYLEKHRLYEDVKENIRQLENKNKYFHFNKIVLIVTSMFFTCALAFGVSGLILTKMSDKSIDTQKVYDKSYELYLKEFKQVPVSPTVNYHKEFRKFIFENKKDIEKKLNLTESEAVEINRMQIIEGSYACAVLFLIASLLFVTVNGLVFPTIRKKINEKEWNKKIKENNETLSILSVDLNNLNQSYSQLWEKLAPGTRGAIDVHDFYNKYYKNISKAENILIQEAIQRSDIYDVSFFKKPEDNTYIENIEYINLEEAIKKNLAKLKKHR